MKTFWKILAAVLTATALALFVAGNMERAFIVAVVGAVAWFLSYRAQLTEKLRTTDDTDEKEADL